MSVSSSVKTCFQFGENFADAPGYEALQKTEVRVALQYAIDVPTICQTLLGTECERASSMVNPPNNNPNLEPYPTTTRTWNHTPMTRPVQKNCWTPLVIRVVKMASASKPC